MRSGGGKGKGSSYERLICKRLSLWITAGKKEDCFWRSAMSGGRATVAQRKGKEVRQAGDITAVSPEGHALTDVFYIELKHYKKLDIESFFLKGQGTLANFWRTAVKEARKHDRQPLMIVRQNRTPDLVLSRPSALSPLMNGVPKNLSITLRSHSLGRVTVWLLDEMLACPFKVR